MPFLCKEQLSFVIISGFILIITLVSGVNPRTLLLSALSYFIIVLIPYLFGLLMSVLFFSFATQGLGAYGIFLRPFKLLLLWVVSILYFHSTPMKTGLGLLDKLLTPLKLIGIPVKDYLKILMCIVIELKEIGPELKQSMSHAMHTAVGENTRNLKINVKAMSQIIVILIVNSFEKLNRIESRFEKISSEYLYYYRFKFAAYEKVSVISFLLFTLLVLMIEKG